MLYYVGDIPAEDLVIEPARAEEPIDLVPFDTATAQLRDPAGTLVVSSGFLTVLGAVDVVVEWPDDVVLTTAGLYTLTLTLEHSVTGKRERLAPVYIVVQADDGWLTLDGIRDDWPDARSIGDRKLHELLTVARDAITSYAPALGDGTPVPVSYRTAQAMQARNVWNAAKVDPANGGIGEDSFVIRPFPLDWMIKQIVRPKTAVPAVG